MARIDAWVFGYRKISIPREHLPTASSLLVRAGIIATVKSEGTITVRERDVPAVRTILGGKIPFSESEVMGAFGAFRRIKHKRSIGAAILVGLVIVFICSYLVWDIRVSGNESMTDTEVSRLLSEAGFQIGDFWHKTDRADVETKLLSLCDEISWVNINRRGTVAYVSIIESKNTDEESTSYEGYANVVADFDCVIEEIDVFAGTPLVKPGDVVKKGDLLILGVLPAESGSGFTYASGSVVGRISDTVTVEVPREYERKERTGERLCERKLNIFNFSINIFKLYGNSYKGCDIIEDVKVFSLLGEKKLPFSVSSKYIANYDSTVASYTDEQLTRVAASRLGAACALRLAECDLVKIKTYGRFTDDGYTMSSHVVFLKEVGKPAEFTVE